MGETAGDDRGEAGDGALCRARFACVSWSMLESCGLRIELPCLRSRADVGFGTRCFACAPVVLRAALALSRARVASADSNAALDNAVVDRNPA